MFGHLDVARIDPSLIAKPNGRIFQSSGATSECKRHLLEWGFFEQIQEYAKYNFMIMNDMDDKSDMEETLGGRIVTARASEEISTAQLARRIGVQTETLSEWETDRSEPRANQLVTMSGLLNVSPTWLLTGLGESPSEDLNATGIASMRSIVTSMRERTQTLVDELDGLDKRLADFQSCHD